MTAVLTEHNWEPGPWDEVQCEDVYDDSEFDLLTSERIEPALPDRPGARVTDPRSSHETDQEIRAEGIRGAQAREVYAKLEHYEKIKPVTPPTAKELADIYNLDRYMVSRRLADLAHAGFVHKVPDPEAPGREAIRKCRVGGRPSCVWQTVNHAAKLEREKIV